MTGFVWYVAYGSNMCAARLAIYLEGGCAPGGLRSHAGARDPSPPRADRPMTLPGTVFFAGESLTWGGGRAFYDPDVPGPTPARAYLLTCEQFDDVRAQEPSVYDRLLEVGLHEGIPMLTFTSRTSRAASQLTAPAAAYVEVIATGIREAHNWDDARFASYIAKLTQQVGLRWRGDE